MPSVWGDRYMPIKCMGRTLLQDSKLSKSRGLLDEASN